MCMGEVEGEGEGEGEGGAWVRNMRGGWVVLGVVRVQGMASMVYGVMQGVMDQGAVMGRGTYIEWDVAEVTSDMCSCQYTLEQLR